MDDALAILKRIRAKYPTPIGARHAAFLIEAAKATGAKLLEKDGGSHVTLPSVNGAPGINVSMDILVFADGAACYDILGDAGNTDAVQFDPKGAIAGTYVDVSAYPSDDQGTPPQEPRTITVQISPSDLAVLERAIREVGAAIVASFTDYETDVMGRTYTLRRKV